MLNQQQHERRDRNILPELTPEQRHAHSLEICTRLEAEITHTIQTFLETFTASHVAQTCANIGVEYLANALADQHDEMEIRNAMELLSFIPAFVTQLHELHTRLRDHRKIAEA